MKKPEDRKTPGRKKLPEDKALSEKVNVRLTRAQYKTYKEIGGQKAFRRYLDFVGLDEEGF